MKQQELHALVSELRALPYETEWVEFKENNNRELGQYLSALSNSACLHDQPYGYLIFGIDDQSHRVVGTQFDLNKKGKGNEDLIPWLARLLNPRVHFDAFVLNHDDGKVVVFQVKATLNTPVTFEGTSYIRVGSYKKSLSEYPEKERMIWTKEPLSDFEKGAAMEELTAEEVLKVLDYPSYFSLMNIPLPSERMKILEKFKQEKLVELHYERYTITNLGAILFAKRLDHFADLSRKAIRVIFYEGKNKKKTLKEQTGAKGYAVGFEGLVDFIDEQLPSKEIIVSVLREEVKMYPKLAIRELIANALIHQDFTEKSTGPMVEIFSDRIEISNPGKPLIDTLRFVDHNPQSRNEKLAQFMRRLNICEERGSGVDKILFECEYAQLPAPKFVGGENYTRVILYAHRTLRNMAKEDKIRACYLHSCLKVVSGEAMTNTSLRTRFGIEAKNYSMVSRIIAEAIKADLVKDFDPESSSKKHAKYLPFWA